MNSYLKKMKNRIRKSNQCMMILMRSKPYQIKIKIKICNLIKSNNVDHLFIQIYHLFVTSILLKVVLQLSIFNFHLKLSTNVNLNCNIKKINVMLVKQQVVFQQ